MKRRFTILITVALLLTSGLAWAQTIINWTASEQGYENQQVIESVTFDSNVTGTFFQGTNSSNPPKYFNTGQAIRCYGGNYFTITSTSDNLTNITLSFASGEGTNAITADVGTYSNGTWTGNSASVTFTIGGTTGHRRIASFSITYGGETPTPTVATPTFDPAGGNFTEAQSVTISCTTEGATIYYTLDGEDPATSSSVYTEALTISETTTVKAMAVKTDYNNSAIAEATYTITVPSGDEQWVFTNLADLTENDVFVIVGDGYAMTNNNGTGSAPATSAVTIENDMITSDVAANIQWTVSGDATNGYTFYPNGSTTTWLYCNTTNATGSNNNMRVGTGNRKVFELNTSNYLLTKDDYTTRYLSIYNNADWRGYVNINLCPVISFYKKVTGGVLPPSITASDNVEIAYDATSVEIEYTINNEPDPVGTFTVAVTDGDDWLTLGQSITSPIQFTCTANEAATERTATVTLTYTYGDNQTATKNVTVTQAGNPNVLDYISDITEVGADYHVKGMVVATSNKGFIICDGTGLVYTYLNAAPTYQMGDFVQITGTTGSYNHVIQFTSSATIAEAEIFDFEWPEYMVITEVPNYTEGNHLSDYFQFEGTLTKSGNNYLVAVGEGQIRISYPTDEQAANLETLLNKTVRIHGFFTGYSGSGNNAVFTAMMESYEEVVAPAVSVTPNVINAPAEGEDGTLAITYENIPDLFSFDYYFCNANGVELEDTDPNYPQWILAEINEPTTTEGYTLYYLISANESEARTAYLKVYTTDTPGNEEVYAIVTINQAAYVAPPVDYAVLPFSFDGGVAQIENTNGLTQNGLGSDYSSSPKLKFNDEGDWLLLKFNERPGTLSFKIKGNPSNNVWAGTFNVQTSEDGVTYTNFAIYDNLTNTVQPEEFDNLGENVRYIKWIYTEKTSGNVALGDIHLNQHDNTPTITVNPDEFTNVMYEGETIEATVVWENFEGEYLKDFVYYGSDGVTPVQNTWFEIQGENEEFEEIYILVEPNDGAARTGYFKAYAVTNDGEYYSNLVTINQAAYVAPAVNYTITFNENGQETETLEIAEGEIGNNLPTAAFGTVPANSKFVGWSLTPVTDYNAGNYFTTTAPEMVDTTYNLESDVTFYAVYVTVRNEVAGAAGWVKVTSMDEFPTGQRFLIVNEAEGKVAGIIDNSVLTAIDATFENGILTSDYPNSYKMSLWEGGDEGSWAFRYLGNDGNDPLNGAWLAATSAKKLTWIAAADATDENKSARSWFISFDNDGNAIIRNGVESYGRFLYNVGSPRFTTYTSNPTANMLLPQLYREQGIETEYNEYYFSQITELSEAVTVTDNQVLPYNYTTVDGAAINIENGGELTVSGLLFNLDPARLVIKEGGQLKMPNKVRAGTIQKNITGYGNAATNNGNYYLLGIPMKMSYDKAVNSGMIGSEFTGNPEEDFNGVDVYHFAAANPDGTEWLNLKAHKTGDTQTTDDVNGYFGANPACTYLYANTNNVLLSFATSAVEASDGFLPTTEDRFETAIRNGGVFDGWNLIRNPYVCNAYLRSGRDFYRMNGDGNAIVLASETTGGNVIEPCEAVFVVVEENDPEQAYIMNIPIPGTSYIYFTTIAPQAPGNAQLNMTVSRNGKSLDAARVRIDNGSMIGKMVFSESATRLSIAQGSKDYSVVRSDAQGEMPVNFKAETNGTYTFSVNTESVEMNYLHLIDNMTGADVDLLVEPSYTFEAKTTDYVSRFRLVFSANDENGASTGSTTFAFFNGSEWCISNTGEATLQMVDVTGRIVSSKTVNGNATLTTDNLSAGVYVMRLINGNDVKVQKVIVR